MACTIYATGGAGEGPEEILTDVGIQWACLEDFQVLMSWNEKIETGRWCQKQG